MKNKKETAFAVYFKKLPQLLLAGAIFSAVLSAFTALFVLIGNLTGFRNIIIYGLGIFPSFIFLPGLVMVVRKYGVEKSFVPVIKTYIEAVKSNYRQFIIHGFVVYLLTLSTTFAFLYYGAGAKESAVSGALLGMYILFGIVLLAAVFYLLLMSVTYDLKLTDLYKNSVLLVFGTLIRTVLALLFTALVAAFAVLLLAVTQGAVRAVVVVLLILLCPMTICYGTTAIIAKGVENNVGSFTQSGEKPIENIVTEEERAAAEEVEAEGDYVFVNGKMIKR